MKRIMKIYDSCKIAIRISFFGFLLVAIGFLIQNESVNIFYTFKNSFVLFISEASLRLGTTIIANLPMIFMLNIVCKRANSAYPVCLALIGYFSYMIVTMLLGSSTLASTAYATSNGINTILNINTGTRYPFETGLIGSFIVAYITRASYVRSRHRNSYSLLGFLNRDSAGIIYNIVFCGLAGLLIAYLWPLLFGYLQNAVSFIAKDINDPLRLAVYGILDRVLSILGLNRIIRQPFWYTALGGSLQTITGQTIAGDINIWNYVKDSSAVYIGAGRFITAFYVINLFVVPACYLGIVLSMSDKEERKKFILPMIGGILLSIICGNPLPLELMLLFTSPLLLILYLLVIGATFYYLTYAKIFLGSTVTAGSVITAMPGNFPDYIINLRNVNYSSQLFQIILVGVVAFVIMFIFTMIYNHFLSFDISRSGKARELAKSIIEAVGGIDNVASAGSGLFKVCVHLKDLEKVDIDKIQDLNINKINETKDGIDIECGASAYIIANRIQYFMILEENNNKVA